MLKRYHDTTTRNTSGNRLIACCFYRSWLCNNYVSKATLLNFKGTVSYSSNSSGHAVYLNDFVRDNSSLQFPTSPTISDHIIKTLNHNNTNEDSSNPGGGEIFSFIVDAESNLTHPKWDWKNCFVHKRRVWQQPWRWNKQYYLRHSRKFSGGQCNHVPLFHKSSVSRLGAIIIVMLFSLTHQLPGQALLDLVKALLTDGHKFVSSTY